MIAEIDMKMKRIVILVLKFFFFFIFMIQTYKNSTGLVVRKLKRTRIVVSIFIFSVLGSIEKQHWAVLCLNQDIEVVVGY